ncbi:ATP-binding protein [Kangiella sp. TOML190]|uniref:ATP-binding protein n=1 Tax=Kangiella sp. TOML190 TaxID=2931351 RepID=UPI00203FB282|nr:ATP-binding protein [Kangiella sp. TOML190]
MTAKILVRLLLLLALLAIIGWAYAFGQKTIEQQTLEANRQDLKFYRNIFQQLLEKDKNFVANFNQEQQQNAILILNRTTPILLDGYGDEWFSYKQQSLAVRNDKTPSSLSLIEDKRFFYGLLEVTDNHLVYRKNPYSNQSTDMFRVDFGQGYWLFQPQAPGKMMVLKEKDNGFSPVASVLAILQETQAGYQIEFRAPKALIGDRLNAVLYDADDKTLANFNEQYQGIFSFTNFESYSMLSENKSDWLLSNDLSEQQLILADASGQQVFSVGSLFEQRTNRRMSSFSSSDKVQAHINKLKQTASFELNDPNRVYQASDKAGTEFFIANSGVALKLNERLLGYLLVCDSAYSYKRLLHNIVLMIALAFILLWLLSSFMVMKQSRIYNRRINQLRQVTEDAYEQDLDSVEINQAELKGSDEVSQLYNSLYYFNERAGQKREHHRKMVSRLNHELRTPIAIISSSLDNLAMSKLSAEDKALLASAQQGSKRLSLTLSRLSEANRLEEAVAQVSMQQTELVTLLKKLIQSYQQSWSEYKFEFVSNVNSVKIKANQELFAQMLDKIITNALDFSDKKEPIVLSLNQNKDLLVLSVSNSGPTIIPEQLKSIFNLMVSYRENAKIQPKSDNLGLGLYMAKLIARKHKAIIQARNRKNQQGVVINLSWTKSSYVVS